MKSEQNFVQERIRKSIAAKERLLETHSSEILQAGHKLVEVIQAGGKIMFCGNGGSAADSQHLAAELVCKLKDSRRPLAGLALPTDSSILTSIGNDFGFNDIFSRQVTALGNSKDALIGISTSGKSANVLAAVTAAKELDIFTVGLLGYDGGPLRKAVDHAVIVGEDDTQRIQECHIMIGHIWMEIIEHELFG